MCFDILSMKQEVYFFEVEVVIFYMMFSGHFLENQLKKQSKKQ